jgi:phage shock protein PspC (stress-responsive transcriptional regulator)
MLVGVAAGVADALDADPSIIRIAWALLAIFTGGIAFIVYIVMAIVVPEYPDETGVGGPWSPPRGTQASAPLAGAAPFAEPTAPAEPTPSAAQAPSAIRPTSYWADDREARRAARRARRAAGEPGRGGLVAGVILIVIGGVFLAREFVPWFDWNLWWPIGLIGLGALLLVVALQPGRSSD